MSSGTYGYLQRLLTGFPAVVISATVISCTEGGGDRSVSAEDKVAAAVPAVSPPAMRPPVGNWAITDFGIGRLRAGMSAADARALFPRFSSPPGADSTGCYYAAIEGLPPGVMVMVDENRIGRIDVRSGNLATAAGARIGDSEDRIAELYGQRMRVSPHKYTSGHYLTVQPSAPGDSDFRTVFETDGKRVLRYRVGVRPPVEYVEGCS